MIVAVLGASPNPTRYSNKAIRELLRNGHEVIPIHPTEKHIEGLKVEASLTNLNRLIDTLTVYVGPQNIAPLISDIIKARPKRVILNPGTESEALENQLRAHAIPYLHACTLVMLTTKQF